MSIELAELTWGEHPLNWPMPPPKRPHFWNRQSLARLRDLEGVFGHLSNEALQRYWQEVAKGQSVCEDCGGYLLRCYKAMCGEDVEEPVSQADVIAELLEEVGRQ